ncbi:MAG: type II toxin-antitoxin system HicA family toxin [Minisyncoccia bacterium]
MPKLPSITSKKLLKMLAQVEFEVDHTTGSHYILYRAKDNARVTVPFHSKDIPKGTLYTIMKSAGLLE